MNVIDRSGMRPAARHDMGMRSGRHRLRHWLPIGAALFAGVAWGGNAAAAEVSCQVMGRLNALWGDANPASELVVGSDDGLHGVTTGFSPDGYYAPAIAFRMSRDGKVSRVATLPGTDEYQPHAHGQMVARNGNYYGVTDTGGFWGNGLAYRLKSHGQLEGLFDFTKWRDNDTNHAICPLPQTKLLEASDGALYGLTGSACAFRIKRSGRFSVVHRFEAAEGKAPFSALIQGGGGLFYGTADGGGPSDLGTLFSLDADGQVTVLHAFAGGTGDGANPGSNPVEGPDGALYGVARRGGVADQGVVYRLGPDGQFSVLHHFGTGDGALVGAVPSLLLARDGRLYGVTDGGGQHGHGGVYQVTTTGDFALLQSFGHRNSSCPVHSASSGLVEWDDGEFYGTDFGVIDVRLNKYKPGAIYRITLK